MERGRRKIGRSTLALAWRIDEEILGFDGAPCSQQWWSEARYAQGVKGGVMGKKGGEEADGWDPHAERGAGAG